MKRLFLLQSTIAALLALGIVVFAGRLAELAGPSVQWDIAGTQPASLPAELRLLLNDMAGQLDATLFISPRERMPSHLQDVEQATRALLQAMADASDGALSFRVIDPDRSGIAGARYAASRRVSPIRVRRVLDDEESQAEIWSSLVVSRRGQPRRNDILIQGIENAHLPHLGGLLAAHLRSQRPQAAFALSAPPGFDEMPRYLSQHGPVVEVDVDAAGAMPHDVDVLFWIEPRIVTPRHIAALKRFLADGGTVVLAGSPWHMRYSSDGSPDSSADNSVVRFRAEPAGDAWRRLLEPFGLRPQADLVLDRNSAAAPVLVDGKPRNVAAPFHLRNLPAFRDFRPLRTPARGGLSFIAPGPLQIFPSRIAAAGYDAHVAATTTERARVQVMPPGDFGLQDLQTELVAPKQNLMVLLTPQDPWAGQLLVLASSSPFRNGIVSQAGFGHAVFVADLARSFADPEQLVRRRVPRHAPPPLPTLSDTGRVGWRLFVVAFVPALWLLAGLRRLAGDTGLRWPRPGRSAWRTGLVLGSAVLVWLLLDDALAAVRMDATDTGLHTPSPEVVAQLQQQNQVLQAELLLSPPSQVSADLRAVWRRTTDMLDQAGVATRVTRIDPSAVVAGSAPPFEVERIRQDTVVTTTVYSALRLTARGRSVTIPRLDNNTGRHLDFLLAAALRRLDTGAAPIVTVVSDLPRLSPAEALEDFQKKGLSAPQGVDVYSHAKLLLTDYGYDVRHVSPREPLLPDQAGAVLWFQPRRDSTPVLTQLSQHLGHGGHAVVAMQHFNIQQRQYRGSGFETVHWPQPQFQDFDRYLRLVGVEQAREVLFDRTDSHLQLDTQVNRTAVREYDAQRVALPFLIRAVSANLSGMSPITANLGDLLFVWGNRFVFDSAVAAQAGMAAQVLATTTDQAWAYDWRGGWLPAQVLEPAGNARLPGPQPLVVLLEGRFPVVEAERTDDAGTQLVQREAPAGPQGWLLLIGSSEMFKDSHLLRAGFAHEQLLLNAVAHAVYGPELAQLQGRQLWTRHGAATRGFADVSPTTRSAWRFAVIGGGPLLLALVALWRQRSRFGRDR